MSDMKFGVIGTGMIAKIFSDALSLVDGASKYAIASRSEKRAKVFAEENAFAAFYGTYEELVNDPALDVVYIGSPHSHHYEHALLALQAGKHVLCEKAFTVNAKEAAELIALAREKKLFLMEAMWIRYLPSVKKMMEWINSGLIGDVTMISASFGNGQMKNFDPEHRLFKRELAGGALLDLGIYPLSLVSMVYGNQPEMFQATAVFNECETDTSCNMLLEYGSNRQASVSVSLEYTDMFAAKIYGTKGTIEVNGFWWTDRPYILHREGERDELIKYDSSDNARGYSYEIEEVIACIREGKLESPLMPLDESLGLMQTMDTVREIIGLSYPMDER